MIPAPIAEWLEAQSALAVLLWMIALSSVAFGVVGFVMKVVPFFQRVSHFFDDWFGEDARDGKPASPGVMLRLQAIETTQTAQTTKLDAVHHEVFPNSGKSLRDRTDQTSHVVRAMARELGMDPDDLEDPTPTKEKR